MYKGEQYSEVLSNKKLDLNDRLYKEIQEEKEINWKEDKKKRKRECWTIKLSNDLIIK